MLNWRMLSHPMNYATVGLMVLIASIAITFLLPAFGVQVTAENSSKD